MPQDDVYDELYQLFDYNPPTLHLSPYDKPPFSYPSLTYDKHLDPRLILRNVKILPTLLTDLAQVATNKIDALKGAGHHLPCIDSKDYQGFRTKKYRDMSVHKSTALIADHVARFYDNTSFQICASAASTLSLHTDAETWLPIVDFLPRRGRINEHFRSVTESYELNICQNATGELDVPDVIWSCLDEVTQARVRHIPQLSSTLITYQFHVPYLEVESLFQDLGRVVDSMVDELPIQCSDIPGSLVVEHRRLVSPDADTTSRVLSVTSPETAKTRTQVEVRKSARLASQKPPKMNGKKENFPNSGGKEGPAETWPTVTIKPDRRREGASSFLRSAWMRSVQDDTSFIVFYCGKYERLGFRHRASQTLYISELIDVRHCREPAYGAIHVGLYMTVLRDALDRVELFGALTKSKTQKRKRSDSTEKTDVKRPKTRYMASKVAKDRQIREEKCQIVVDEVRGRNLMLLRLQYGLYSSSAPAAFYRVGGSLATANERKDKYRPDEYFYLTLTSELSVGATGRLHLAEMKAQTAAKLVHKCQVVVKVALDPDQQQRLRHEHVVYRHLATEGVKQIPQIYGMFEDASGEAVILVMNNVGKSLDENDDWPNGSLRDEEKEAFKRAMTGIHQAGVRHYDIRPENLVMDDVGNASIIDFDQAKIGAGSHSRQREYEHLCSLLEGEDNYEPPNEFPSPPTTQGSPSDHEGSD